MKNMKSKLLASVAMLLVSAIMLTSASFAWFTISTAPEITGLTTQVVVNDNLEIALHAGKLYAKEEDVDAASNYIASDTNRVEPTENAYTWGNLAALSTATGYAGVETVLRPAYLDVDGKFWYPTYGADGRISGMEELVETALPDKTGTGAYKGEEVAFGHLIGEGGHVYGYYVDFWIRSNKSGTVTLAEAGNRVAGDDNTEGEGSIFTATSVLAAKTAGTTPNPTDPEKVLSENIRVAFKVTGADEGEVNEVATAVDTVVPTAGTPAVAKPDGTAKFEGSVVKLDANVAKQVRMYVYLDGQNVTNASASLTAHGEGANAVAAVDVGGILNIQFTMEGVNTAMNVTGAAATEPENGNS